MTRPCKPYLESPVRGHDCVATGPNGNDRAFRRQSSNRVEILQCLPLELGYVRAVSDSTHLEARKSENQDRGDCSAYDDSISFHHTVYQEQQP